MPEPVYEDRVETDQTFRKLPDGSMEVVETRERTIPAREVELEDATAIMRRLFAKSTWTAADTRRVLSLIAHRLFREDFGD